MDQDELVDIQIDAGRRLMNQLALDRFEFAAAFWVKPTDENFWYLCVVTSLYDQVGPTMAYRRLIASLQKLPDVSLPISFIRLFGPEDSTSKDLFTILDHDRSQRSFYYGGRLHRGRTRLGELDVDMCYLYPRQKPSEAFPSNPEGVIQEMIKLMSRKPDSLLPSRITLKDGSEFEGIPYSIQMDGGRGLVAHWIVNAEPIPRVVKIDDIRSVA